MKPALCLLVEDLPEAAESLTAVVRMAFPETTCRWVGGVAEALAAVEEAAPDLALVDLSLPDGSGIAVIEALACRWPECVIVVATIFDDDAHLFPAIQAGAQGYLLKEQAVEKLAAQLSGIGDGQPPLSPAIARRLMGYFQQREGSAPEASLLTARETEVLRHLARGIRVAEIAQSLGITRHTAAGYVKTIYRKLSISSRAEAALKAVKMGLLD